jgi:hypothetical protein
MNDKLDSLEKQLKGMRPRRVSDSLSEKIGEEIGKAVRFDSAEAATGSRRARVFLAYAGLAASLLVALGLWYIAGKQGDGTGAPSTAMVSREPAGVARTPAGETSVLADTYLLKTQDEGITLNEDAKPVRKVRCKLLDAVQWDEPGDRSKYRMVGTRDTIAYVPVRVY